MDKVHTVVKEEEPFAALQNIASIFIYGGFTVATLSILIGLLGLDSFDAQWKAVAVIVGGILSAVGMCATGYVIKLLLQIEINTRKR